MQELHKKYEPQGLSVLAFPCNQFGGQEPKPEAEIKEFVKKFSVEFDMFSKINVNGDGELFKLFFLFYLIRRMLLNRSILYIKEHIRSINI
jgi:glutathione peroxidase-family protein